MVPSFMFALGAGALHPGPPFRAPIASLSTQSCTGLQLYHTGRWPMLYCSGRWPMLSPEAVSGRYARRA
eukprot:5069484-Prymnesium_polylepis.1